MSIHEPCAAYEVFLGNTSDAEHPKDLAHLQTLRFGKVAYDLNGEVIPDMRPIFITSSEYPKWDRIMSEKLEDIRRGYFRGRRRG